MRDIVKQIAGNMALSGMDLTKEDHDRIQYFLDHPEEEKAILQELFEKYRGGSLRHEKMSDYN